MRASAEASRVQLPARGRLPALGGAGGGRGEKAIGVDSAHPPGHLRSQPLNGMHMCGRASWERRARQGGVPRK